MLLDDYGLLLIVRNFCLWLRDVGKMLDGDMMVLFCGGLGCKLFFKLFYLLRYFIFV